MNQELRDIQLAAGATLGEVAGVTVPMSFGNEAAARQEIQTGVVLYDRSHWGRIRVLGDDRVRFLHNQSTNDFECLKAGQSCDTVFVTSTARTIDLATAFVTEDAILLLVSPNRQQQLMTWLDRYLFPMDKVDLEDITNTTACFTLMRENSAAFLQNLGISADFPHGTHQVVSIDGIDVRIATGSGLATAGYTLIFDANDAAILWKKLVDTGAVPFGEKAWEQLRIREGRPVPDAELTEDYNPLEAGLWQTISFEKGCYIGQETIARLNTYKGVKTQLWGIRLATPAEPGTVITIEDDKIGTLTSVVATESGVLGLAYIRTKAGGAGLKVQVGDASGEVVDVPFLTRGYLGE
ncbi:MAG: folate-binding protein [Geitlerinemataceae cyanobacterium]